MDPTNPFVNVADPAAGALDLKRPSSKRGNRLPDHAKATPLYTQQRGIRPSGAHGPREALGEEIPRGPLSIRT